MSKHTSPIIVVEAQMERLLSGLSKFLILALVLLSVSGCSQSPSNMAPTTTPIIDPKQSGSDLLNYALTFSYITNKMADKYLEGDVDYIKQNLPDLNKIALSTDLLTVSSTYSDARFYLSKMMWSQISFYDAINQNPSLDISTLLPVAQEGTAYYNLFVIEMENLGHDLITE